MKNDFEFTDLVYFTEKVLPKSENLWNKRDFQCFQHTSPFLTGCVPPLSTLAYLTLSDSKEELLFFFYFGVCVFVGVY